MLSDEEKEVIENLTEYAYATYEYILKSKDAKIILNLIEKQSKEIEELKETLKCTQNSWFEDTQKIEEMKKQIDLDNECEIALNNKIMDLEKEIEELKENNKQKYYHVVKSNELEEEINNAWENKIKAKIEELDEEIKVKREIAKNPMDRVSGILLTDSIVELEKTKKVLQSLLEKE